MLGFRHKADTHGQTAQAVPAISSVRMQQLLDWHDARYQTAFRTGNDLHVGLARTVLSRYGVYELLCCYASSRAYLLDGRGV